jgi:hypothetical protein
MDFHGNRVDEAASETSVLWPGPIINNNEVILSVNGRTRLLVSGGFPPYEFKIPEIFQDHAVVSSFDQKSILGLDEGWYTVEIRDSLNYDEPRYVNALVQVPAMTRIGRAFHAYRDPMNYEMVSFPFNLKNWDGGSLVDLLREAGGGVHGTDFILYTFDENNEYVPVDRETLSVGPGYGFWMAYRKNVHPELEAEGPLPDQVVAVDLHSGWNLIGNPFGEKISASNIYISTAGTRISIDNLAQSETEHDLWSIEIEKPQYQAVEELDPFQGAWLHVNNEDGAELVFYRGEENLGVEDVVFEDASEIPSQMSFEEAKSLGRSKLSDESVVAGPPERPGAFHLSSVSNASSTSGAGPSPGAGGGGCLLKREEGK